MLRKILIAMAALLLLAPVASAAHSVTITNADEAKVGTYTMTVEVENFRLVDFSDREAQKGEGHIHYLVNGMDACTAGKADCDAPTDYATPSKSFTFINLEEGDRVGASLVLSDHTNSGTDSNGNLNGAEVAAFATVDRATPGFELLALVAAIGAALVLVRRKAE